MALESDQMAWDVFILVLSTVLEGVILAVVLNKWNDYTEKRRESRKIQNLMSKFYELVRQQEVVDLYYFIKLIPVEDQQRIQSVLLMDLQTSPQSDSMGTRDILILENNRFKLRLDPKWESHLHTKGTAFYNFSKPQENPEFYSGFLDFVKQKMAAEGIPIVNG